MNVAGIVVNDYLRNLDDALMTATNAARSDDFLDAYVFFVLVEKFGSMFE